MWAAIQRTDFTQNEDSTSELQVCRACLAIDTTLYPLHHGLAQVFTDLTAISALDDLPQNICGICRALLFKYAAFKTRTHLAHSLLQRAHSKHWLTAAYVKDIDRSNLSIPLFLTETQCIDILPDGTEKPSPIDDKLFETIIDYDDDITNDDADVKIDLEELGDNTDHKAEIVLEEETNKNDTKCGFSEVFIKRESCRNKKSSKGKTSKKCGKLSFDFIDTGIAAKSKYTKEAPISKIGVKREIQYKSLQRRLQRAKKRKELEEARKEKGLEENKRKRRRKRTDDCKDNENNEAKADTKKIKEDIKKNKLELKRSKTVEEHVSFAASINCKYIPLNKEEQIEKVLARKESSSYKMARFKCEQCFRGFSQEFAFNNHLIGHDPNIGGSFVCEICQLHFASSLQLGKHRRRHKQLYTCNECGHTSELREQATCHHKYHLGFRYECKECGKTFDKRGGFRRHMRYAHGSAACHICGEVFASEWGLKGHINRSHREALISKCESCGVQFQSLAALNRHTEGSCQPDYRACAACGDSFASELSLAEHREQHKIYAEECSTEQVAEGRRRAGVGAPRKVHMCEWCGKRFRFESDLNDHRLLHTGEKPHQCPECPKSFRLPFALRRHMTTHTGARPYQCPYCPMAFRQYSQRVVHLRTHTKEKPYKCAICGKGFVTGGNLKVHVSTIHMGHAPRQRNRQREKTNRLHKITNKCE